MATTVAVRTQPACVTEVGAGDLDIRGRVEGGADQRSRFVIDPAVVGSEQGYEVALRLVGHHLDEVGEDFTFRSQLDDFTGDHILDGDVSRDLRTPSLQDGHALLAARRARPSLPCVILKPRIEGRTRSGLFSAASP
jgi:hypothetical protein